MSAYFQDIRSSVVLKFDGDYDIRALREQVGDYKEVSEAVYNAYKDLTEEKPKKAEKPSK